MENILQMCIKIQLYKGCQKSMFFFFFFFAKIFNFADMPNTPVLGGSLPI